MIGLLRLNAELAAWRRAGQPVLLWWRDDDATDIGPRLERLLALSERHAAPLALAVVPDRLSPDLPPAVNAHAGVSVLQHGLDHRSWRDQGLPPGQFHDDETSAEIAAAVAQRQPRLAAFARSRPVYVPPWNAIHPRLPMALATLDMKLSAFDGLGDRQRVDTHLDLMRWGERPRFRGAGRLMNRTARLLSERRRQGLWDRPVGLLTHHLDHDEAAWRFLDGFLRRLNTATGCRWLTVDQLFGAPPPEGAGALA